MMVSPPASPEAGRMRPQSIMHTSSPEGAQKQRSQNVMQRPTRSNSRLSRSSSRAGTRLSDEDPKTSVKVVVRVRPPLGPTDPGFDLIPSRFQRSMVQVNTNTSLGIESPLGRKMFIFDRVFDADMSQKDVWNYLEESVDSFLLGYNVSILAYGQSGSGKSYTMGTSGPTQQFDPSSKGVIPRAAGHLFDSLSGTSQTSSHARQNSGLKTPTRYSVASLNTMMSSRLANTGEKDWDLSVTYVEIYNEQPRDLLLPEATPVQERPSVQIREDTKGRILVEGLKSVPVNSMEELMAVLNHGSLIRQTDATAINSKSSRSHAIFTVSLRQSKSQGSVPASKDKWNSTAESGASGDTHIMIESKLHFVDLAGSERLKNTGATGERAKEGIAINAGLASLGHVISQLSSKSGGGHVSYRDSKLTRILQDSLGGNAITYMVACVTPAEFHLSETLNTVQYAQRARNIQSKPKIQQINDEADKLAVIDRLKTEVSFLRQQIRSTEGVDRRGGAMADRLHERENELQNQLLDVQESYGALSQRHAKLVSDLTRSSESGHHVAGENAVDRLKRSQENQQQIEQVVLEYEKTIQSLETNLHTTRSSLANTESNLLEKETKCAYTETMNQQLNSRMQKLIDREANTEAYLHELEARLDEQSSGGEKHDAIISELRKEMARIRESETNAEDYICTLEERLAEADQDIEILQREVERLEQLVERQRSLGKMDNLLYELDHVQSGSKAESKQKASSTGISTRDLHSKKQSRGPLDVLNEAEETDLSTRTRYHSAVTEEDRERDLDAENEEFDEQIPTSAISSLPLALANTTVEEHSVPSPAQHKHVTEKFESVSQELFDLKIEHESTVNELDLLSAKYQEALRTLAAMQDSFDEVRHTQSRGITSPEPLSRSGSFLDEGKMDNGKHGQRGSSSRSLSSELSLAGESTSSVEASEVTALPSSRNKVLPELVSESGISEPGSGTNTPDVGRLQVLLTEHERNMKDATERYSQLQIEHKDALRQVEKLRNQVRLGHQKDTQSPGMPGMIRRMTSNVNSGIDRGQRSIVSLRAFIAEQLEGKPELMEGAETHLNSATQELQSRVERIHSLDAELKNVRKEMEMKSTIISGLTRERNSVRAGTPVDLSMVSQMRDQLIQKERELKSLHEGYAKREQELQAEIVRLSEETGSRGASPSMNPADKETELAALKEELAELVGKHEDARQNVRHVEKRLTVTNAELEASRASVATLRSQQVESPGLTEGSGKDMVAQTAVASAMQSERNVYEEAVAKLKHELEEQVTTNATNVTKISELTQAHSVASKNLREHKEAVRVRTEEIAQHKDRISGLERQIEEAQAAVEFHKHGLRSLHETHANEIEEMKLSHAGVLASYDDKYDDMTVSHEKHIKELNEDLEQSRANLNQLINGAQLALGHPTSHAMLVNHIQDLLEEKKSAESAKSRLLATNTELERQLNGRQSLEELEESVTAAEKKISNYQETIRSLANEVGNHEETIREKEKSIQKHETTIESITAENHKKVLLIEELEQQLQTSYEHHQNRLSVVQAQGNQALVDAHSRISALEKEVQRTSMAGEEDQGSRTNTMKSQNRPQSPSLADRGQRSDSMTSNLRKSASIASLPSPPPAIPLPPLPTLPGISIAQSANPSPPQSRHASKEVATPITPVSISGSTNTAPTTAATSVIDPRNTQAFRRQSAIIEDQDSRLRTMEKHLHAEKQLTATLEEALVDLETQSNKLRVDAEGWKKKAWAMEEELASMRKERRTERLSVQAVEEEVKKRREAEAARAQLEERMRLLQGDGTKKKKKGGTLNCF